MKFKDAIAQGLANKDKKRRKADAQEKASARMKAGKPERRNMPTKGEICRCGWPLSLHRDGFICEYRCTKPTIGKPPHCGDPGCYDHEGWS